MKVLHIGNHFWPSKGGIEQMMLELAKESQKQGIEAKVLCLNREHHSQEVLPAQGSIDRISIRRVPFLNLKYYKPALLPIQELKKADILHVHGVSALLDFVVLTKWLHCKPIVVSTHGGIFHTPNISLFKKIYFFGIEKIVLRFVDAIAAVSQNDYELFKRVAQNPILIENGLDLKRFTPNQKKKKDWRRFLFVGRLSPNKRIDNLLNVFGVLHKRGMDFELRIVGGDWNNLLPELREQARKMGIDKKVFFLGAVPEKELLKEYEHAGFFVSASEYEGFGISAIEAMASGCIPILNRIESFRNFIQDGKNGFLADFSDADQTSQKILELGLKKSRELDSIQKNAVQFVSAFSWGQKIQEWEKLYESVARK